jgi:hypothetical protein
MKRKNSPSGPASPESEDSNSDSNGPADLKPAGKSRTIPMRPPSCVSIGPVSRATEISETFLFPSESMLSAADSHARTFPLPERAEDSKGSDPLFGGKCFDSFAKLSPDGSWLKMYQGSSQAIMGGSWEEFLETWPANFLMRGRECYQRPEWEPRTLDDEYSFWRTPSASEADHGGPNARDSKGGLHLSAQVAMFPTPRAQSARGSGPSRTGHRTDLQTAARAWSPPCARDGQERGPCDPEKRIEQGHSVSLHDQIGGQLNPTWVEWLMGFPLGWTALDASEMPSSPRSHKRSAK